MRRLKIIKFYLVNSQFWVALCGTMLAAFFMLESGILRWPTLLLMFLTYFSGYFYTKYQDQKIFFKILILNAVCGLVCAALILQNHDGNRLLRWLAIIVLGILYNSRFLNRIVRKIPLVKIFYVGLVWALMHAWLAFEQFSIPAFSISLFYVSALVLPFDIRDMLEDEIVTFPRLIGIQNTKILASLLLAAAAAFGFCFLKEPFALAFALSCAVSILLVCFSNPSNQESYFSFWVELCTALPLLFVVILLYF